ncbi:MAG: DUF2520 domain-containing protein, partial [Chloroflexota bacterium]|nr:DUF2520 domain-containing protein [Chloroflexota bacterium]
LLISGADRPRYHAGAVLAGNASVALLEAARRQLIGVGVDADVAGRVLARLLASVADNVTRHGLDEALSGPIRRGDVGTVLRNLDALDAADPAAAEAYRELGRITVAVARGLPSGPSGEVAARLLDALATRRR